MSKYFVEQKKGESKKDFLKRAADLLDEIGYGELQVEDKVAFFELKGKGTLTERLGDKAPRI